MRPPIVLIFSDAATRGLACLRPAGGRVSHRRLRRPLRGRRRRCRAELL